MAVRPIPFEKFHGLENDYLIVSGGDVEGYDHRALAKAMCDRRSGIGGDGLLVLTPRSDALEFRIVNADGSDAELCGNGLRCAAATMGTGSVKIVSAVGEHCGEVQRVGSETWKVALNLVRATHEEDLELSFGVVHVLRVGNPHAVVFVKHEQERTVLQQWHAELERLPQFSDGVNVHVARRRMGGGLHIQSWERGVGYVKACATGAAACAVAGGLRGPCEVEMPGGVLTITVDPDDSMVHMSGPATRVGQGTFFTELEQT